MLDESAIRQAAADVEAREAAERARAAPPAPEAPAEMDDVAQLTGLSDGHLLRVLEVVAPDDLLIVIATADEALRARLMANLSDESVKWVRDNLAYIDEVNDHERDGARNKTLKAVNKLLATREIELGSGTAEVRSEREHEERGLEELLTDLVRIAHTSGPEALADLAEEAGEPMLRRGLTSVLGGKRGEALRAELTPLRTELEQRYARRLAQMLEAVVAIAEREPADAFARRVFKHGQ
ncbi:MAG: FliG C-terminal domain-containing protein [Sandaracinaceae bacterium]